MTRFSIPILAALLLALAGWQTGTTTKLGFTEASRLWVTGTSTIHDWECNAERVDGWLNAELGETLTAVTGGEVTVSAEGLACKNGTMEKKTRKALDAEAHPVIRYELVTVVVNPGNAEGTFTAQANGKLTIAGQTKTVVTTVEGKGTDEGYIHLSGSVPITMSEYGIDPPTAMLGTLKTGDDVTVHFDLIAAPASDL